MHCVNWNPVVLCPVGCEKLVVLRVESIAI